MNLPPTIKSWLQLIRLPAGASVISNIFVAHTIAVLGNHRWGELLLTLFASLSLYYGGMVLNDCFDYQEDARDRPQRPLPAGQIELKTAWISGYVLLLTGCLIAAMVNQQVFIISIILAGLIVIYDSNFLPVWPRAIVMGLCRYSNWLMAMAVIPLTSQSFLYALPVFFYVVALTRLSQVEISQLTTHRRNELIATVIVSLLLLLLLSNWSFLALSVILVLGGYIYSVIAPVSTPPCTPAEIQQTVGRMVMGLIPLDVAMGLCFGGYWIVLLALLLLLLGRILGKSLYVS